MALNRAQPSRTRGTTLIEVLAGLVVLGTVLASVAIARGRFLRQWADADQTLRVTQALDATLSTWTNGSQRMPVPAEGSLEGAPGYAWRTRWIRDPAAAELSAVIVRVDVFPLRTAQPVLSVDLLVHDPRRDPRPAQREGGRR